jgi:hypothetical protein
MLANNNFYKAVVEKINNFCNVGIDLFYMLEPETLKFISLASGINECFLSPTFPF